MQVTLEKGLGNAFLNTVRSAAYVCCPIVRPIGFKVGGDSTVVSISDSVLEDMTTFISNVSRHVFYYRGNRDLIEATVECDGELMLSALLNGTGVTVNEDVPVLHSNAPVRVSVIFHFGSGNHLIQENEAILENAGYTGYVATNSRHCVVDAFTFNRTDTSDTEEVYEVTLTTIDGSSPDTVFKMAVQHVKEVAQRIDVKIN